jgi:hypothetical protein
MPCRPGEVPVGQPRGCRRLSDDRQCVLAIVQVLDDIESDGGQGFARALVGRLANLSKKIGSALLTAAAIAAMTDLVGHRYAIGST